MWEHSEKHRGKHQLFHIVYIISTCASFRTFLQLLRGFQIFLAKLSEEVIQKVAEHGSFKSMKVNTMSNLSLVPRELLDTSKSQFLWKGKVSKRLLCCFIVLRLLSWCWLRQFSSTLLHINACVLMLGTAGDWKTHFNSEQIARFSSVIRKELQNETFSLPWSLEWPTPGAITETELAAGNRRISSMWKCGAKFRSLCNIIQSNLLTFKILLNNFVLWWYKVV